MVTPQYKSSFSKADMRRELTAPGSRRYRNVNDSQVVRLDDLFVDPKSAAELTLEGGMLHLVVPVVGSVELNDSLSLAPEQVQFASPSADEVWTVQNPYAEETVNLLHIRIATAHCPGPQPGPQPLALTAVNRLHSVTHCGVRLHLGVFDSRSKCTLALDRSADAAFTFVVNGSFDFEERLMEYRDSIFQWDLQEVEFEALSDAAILLILECSL